MLTPLRFSSEKRGWCVLRKSSAGSALTSKLSVSRPLPRGLQQIGIRLSKHMLNGVVGTKHELNEEDRHPNMHLPWRCSTAFFSIPDHLHASQEVCLNLLQDAAL